MHRYLEIEQDVCYVKKIHIKRNLAVLNVCLVQRGEMPNREVLNARYVGPVKSELNYHREVCIVVRRVSQVDLRKPEMQLVQIVVLGITKRNRVQGSACRA